MRAVITTKATATVKAASVGAKLEEVWDEGISLAWRTRRFVDVFFFASNGYLIGSAHKSVLTLYSEFMKELFKESDLSADVANSGTYNMILDGQEMQEALPFLLDLVYTGATVAPSEKTMEGLLDLARIMKINKEIMKDEFAVPPIKGQSREEAQDLQSVLEARNARQNISQGSQPTVDNALPSQIPEQVSIQSDNIAAENVRQFEVPNIQGPSEPSKQQNELAFSQRAFTGPRDMNSTEDISANHHDTTNGADITDSGIAESVVSEPPSSFRILPEKTLNPDPPGAVAAGVTVIKKEKNVEPEKSPPQIQPPPPAPPAQQQQPPPQVKVTSETIKASASRSQTAKGGGGGAVSKTLADFMNENKEMDGNKDTTSVQKNPAKKVVEGKSLLASNPGRSASTTSNNPAKPAVASNLSKPVTPNPTRPAASNPPKPVASNPVKTVTSNATRPVTSSVTKTVISSATRPSTSSATRPGHSKSIKASVDDSDDDEGAALAKIRMARSNNQSSSKENNKPPNFVPIKPKPTLANNKPLQAVSSKNTNNNNRPKETTGGGVPQGKKKKQRTVHDVVLTYQKNIMGAVEAALGAFDIEAFNSCPMCKTDFETTNALAFHIGVHHKVLAFFVSSEIEEERMIFEAKGKTKEEEMEQAEKFLADLKVIAKGKIPSSGGSRILRKRRKSVSTTSSTFPPSENGEVIMYCYLCDNEFQYKRIDSYRRHIFMDHLYQRIKSILGGYEWSNCYRCHVTFRTDKDCYRHLMFQHKAVNFFLSKNEMDKFGMMQYFSEDKSQILNQIQESLDITKDIPKLNRKVIQQWEINNIRDRERLAKKVKLEPLEYEEISLNDVGIQENDFVSNPNLISRPSNSGKTENSATTFKRTSARKAKNVQEFFRVGD